jgi:hypothetical protein
MYRVRKKLMLSYVWETKAPWIISIIHLLGWMLFSSLANSNAGLLSGQTGSLHSCTIWCFSKTSLLPPKPKAYNAKPSVC